MYAINSKFLFHFKQYKMKNLKQIVHLRCLEVDGWKSFLLVPRPPLTAVPSNFGEVDF